VLANPVRTGKPDTRQPVSDASNLTPQNARCIKSDAADASNLTPPQINILQGIKTNNNAGAEPSRQSAPAQPPVVEKTAVYLEAIKAATGHKIDATKTTQQRIAAIKAQGLTPDETATLVAAYLAAGNGAVHNPPGFIAGHVLKSLAEGDKPEPPAVTPTPPSVAELAAAEPCMHGEPRGPSGCALCREFRQLRAECDQRLEQSKVAQRIRADLSQWRVKPDSWADDTEGAWAVCEIQNPDSQSWILTDDERKSVPEQATVAVELAGENLGKVEAVLVDADNLGDVSIRAAFNDWLIDNDIRGEWASENSGYTVAETVAMRCTFAPDQTAKILPHLPALVDLWAKHCAKVYGARMAA
jgi:hypothetical protein